MDELAQLTWLAAAHRNYDVACRPAESLEDRRMLQKAVLPEPDPHLDVPPLLQRMRLDYEPRSMATTDNGRALLIGTKAGTLHYYELNDVTLEFEEQRHHQFPRARPRERSGAIRGCCFLDCNHVALVHDDSLHLYVRPQGQRFDLQCNQPIPDLLGDETLRNKPVRRLVALSPGGRPSSEEDHLSVLILYEADAARVVRFEHQDTRWTASPLQPDDGRSDLPTTVHREGDGRLVDAVWNHDGPEPSLLTIDTRGRVLALTPSGRVDAILPGEDTPTRRYRSVATRGPILAIAADDDVCIVTLPAPGRSSESTASSERRAPPNLDWANVPNLLRHDVWFSRFEPTERAPGYTPDVVWVYASSAEQGVETVRFRLNQGSGTSGFRRYTRDTSRSPRHPRPTGNVLRLEIVEPTAQSPLLIRATQDHELEISSILNYFQVGKVLQERLLGHIASVIRRHGLFVRDNAPLPPITVWEALSRGKDADTRMLRDAAVAWFCSRTLLVGDLHHDRGFYDAERGCLQHSYVPPNGPDDPIKLHLGAWCGHWKRSELLDLLEAEDLRRLTDYLRRELNNKENRDKLNEDQLRQFKLWTLRILERAHAIADTLVVEIAALVARQILDRRRNNLAGLWPFGAFLRKWIVRGYTYEEKRQRLLQLSRWNESCEHSLDALCYLSRLRFARLDLAWEVSASEHRGDVSTWCVAESTFPILDIDGAARTERVVFQSSKNGGVRAILVSDPQLGHSDIDRARVLRWEFEGDRESFEGFERVDRELAITRPAHQAYLDRYGHGAYARTMVVLPSQSEDERVLIIAWRGWRRSEADKRPTDWRPMLVALQLRLEKNRLVVRAATKHDLEAELHCLIRLPGEDDKIIAGTSGQVCRESEGEQTWARIPIQEFEITPAAASPAHTEKLQITKSAEIGPHFRAGHRSYVRVGDPALDVTVDPCTSIAVTEPMRVGNLQQVQWLWAGFRDGEIMCYRRESSAEAKWTEWASEEDYCQLSVRSRVVRMRFVEQPRGTPGPAGLLCYGTDDGVVGAVRFDSAKRRSVHVVHAKESGPITTIADFEEATGPGSKRRYLAFVSQPGIINIFAQEDRDESESLERSSYRRVGRIQSGFTAWDGTVLMYTDPDVSNDQPHWVQRPALVVGGDDGHLRGLDLLIPDDPLVPDRVPSRSDDFRQKARQLWAAAVETDLAVLPRSHHPVSSELQLQPNREVDLLRWVRLLQPGSLALTCFGFERAVELVLPWSTAAIPIDDSTVIQERTPAAAANETIIIDDTTAAPPVDDSIVTKLATSAPGGEFTDDGTTTAHSIAGQIVSEATTAVPVDELAITQETFETARTRLGRLERAAVGLRPIDVRGAKVIWSLAGEACRRIAKASWGAHWSEGPDTTDQLFDYYRRLMIDLEDYCNRWIGRGLAEESDVLIYVFQALFSRFDVLMLAWRMPGKANAQLRKHVVHHILARRLHFGVEVVSQEALRVVNDSIEDAIHLFLRQLLGRLPATERATDRWMSVLMDTCALRPAGIRGEDGDSPLIIEGLPKWKELQHTGFYDLMTLVGDLARARLNPREHTDPLHTAVARFYGLSLVLFPHAVLNIGQVISESGLLENGSRFHVYVVNQARAACERIDDDILASGFEDLFERSCKRLESYLGPEMGEEPRLAQQRAEEAKKRAEALHKISIGADHPGSSAVTYRWHEDIARWTRPFSDDAVALEYDRVLRIADRLRRPEVPDPNDGAKEALLWAQSTSALGGKPSRYFYQSCRYLASATLENGFQFISQALPGKADHEKMEKARRVASETLLSLRRERALFEPQRNHYAAIISTWRTLLESRSARNEKLYDFFERINRHVYRVGADQAMGAVTELVLRRVPTLFDAWIDERGSIAHVLEDRLRLCSPDDRLIGQVFSHVQQLVEQTHMTGLLFSVAEFSTNQADEKWKSRHTTPPGIPRETLEHRFREACLLKNLTPMIAFTRSVPDGIHFQGLQMVWKVMLDEFATNVSNYACIGDDRRLICRVDHVGGKWEVFLAGTRSFEEHRREAVDRHFHLCEDIEQRRAQLEETVMKFGSKGSATGNGVGMSLIHTIGLYVGIDASVEVMDLASEDWREQKLPLESRPLCLRLQGQWRPTQHLAGDQATW